MFHTCCYLWKGNNSIHSISNYLALATCKRLQKEPWTWQKWFHPDGAGYQVPAGNQLVNLFAQLNFKYNINKGFRGVGDEVLTYNRVSYRSGAINKSLLQKTDVRPEVWRTEDTWEFKEITPDQAVPQTSHYQHHLGTQPHPDLLNYNLWGAGRNPFSTQNPGNPYEHWY